MGLKDYRKYKKQQELLAFLSEEFGINKNDLKYLHEALEIVKEIKLKEVNQVVSKPIDEKTRKEFEKAQSQKLTPEQFVEQFAGETEEFYPYGRN